MTEISPQGPHQEPESGHRSASGGPVSRFWLYLSAGVVAGMFVLAYVAPPLCDLYCPGARKGGVDRAASTVPDVILDRTMKIRFDANVNGLKWKFRPDEIEITTKVGETSRAFYSAENISDVTTAGVSTFNVTPLEASQFFSLVECFCFSGHVIAPGETVRMPVRFYVDPAIADFPEYDDIKTITVSYTFFPRKSSRSGAWGTPSTIDGDLAMTAPENPAANLN